MPTCVMQTCPTFQSITFVPSWNPGARRHVTTTPGPLHRTCHPHPFLLIRARRRRVRAGLAEAPQHRLGLSLSAVPGADADCRRARSFSPWPLDPRAHRRPGKMGTRVARLDLRQPALQCVVPRDITTGAIGYEIHGGYLIAARRFPVDDRPMGYSYIDLHDAVQHGSASWYNVDLPQSQFVFDYCFNVEEYNLAAILVLCTLPLILTCAQPN
jgi:hypothetical protein